ncbi:MAG: response regulator transcription factor, partial [Candidatus Tectomicrobia bacterium]|nr:response regulator transcription factor [Candidatus Tectomicrobia bacterium]
AEYCPNVKVLMLGLAEEEAEVAECVEAGVSGYVLRNSSLDDLALAIELVIRGGTACSSEIAHAMFTRLSKLSRAPNHHDSTSRPPLSVREMEILQLIADGWSNQQIATHLCISLYTVKNHVHNILKKLQVNRRSEAVNSVYDLRRSTSWEMKG